MHPKLCALPLVFCLACATAPAHAATSASRPHPARARAARTPPVAPARADATAVSPVVGDTAVDVGGGRSLRIQPDGTISLGEQLLYAPGIGSAKLYQRVPMGDDTIVVVGFGYDDKPSEPGYLVALRIDGAADRATWTAFIRPARPFDAKTLGWRTLATASRLVVVEEDRVLCIDADSGQQQWSFGEDEPALLTEAVLGSDMLVSRPHLQMGDATLVGDRVVVQTWRTADTGHGRPPTPRTVELDLATGWRVHVDTPRARRVPAPLFAFSRTMQIWAGHDDPPPRRPDPPPPHLDGVVIGHAALVWNTKTGEGLVVNPTADDVPEVVAFARGRRVGEGRAARAIAWLGVVDTYAVAESALAGTRTRGGEASAGAELVRLQYLFAMLDTGSHVDAESVATALGIPAVRTEDALPRGLTLRVIAEPGDGRSIELAWDRMRFADSNWRVGQGAVTLLQ